jgi:hypothetical protein
MALPVNIRADPRNRGVSPMAAVSLRLSEVTARHMARGGSTVLWAVLSGAAVIAVHSGSAGLGARLGAYSTGIATLVVFALAAGVALRKHIVRLWPRPGWDWEQALACGSPKDSLKPVPAPPRSGVPLLSLDWPQTWRRVHVTLGIFATLPLWWHCESGPASMLDLTLKSVAILLVMSGFFGLAITEFLPRQMLSPQLMKSWSQVHRGLALFTGLLVVFHVLGVLYFVGI